MEFTPKHSPSTDLLVSESGKWEASAPQGNGGQFFFIRNKMIYDDVRISGYHCAQIKGYNAEKAHREAARDYVASLEKLIVKINQVIAEAKQDFDLNEQ